MLASVAVLMLGFSLPERPLSVSITPQAGLTVVEHNRGTQRLFVNGGASLELGFRPIPYLRVMGLAFGALHETLVDRGGGGGQSGFAGFAGGFEGLLPIGSLELSAAMTIGGGWVDLSGCASLCPFGRYQNVMLIAPSAGVAVRIDGLPWLYVGALVRPIYLLTGEAALHLQFGVRVEARF